MAILNFLYNPADQFERAVRALLIVQNKAIWPDATTNPKNLAPCVTSLDETELSMNHIEVTASSVNLTRPYNSEGEISLAIQCFYTSVLQDGEVVGTQKKAFMDMVAGVMTTLNCANQDALLALAAQITVCGRWLAAPGANPTSYDLQIANQNADMVNFRCDWVKFGTPWLTRGNPKREKVAWAEVIHIIGQVSQASN